MFGEYVLECNYGSVLNITELRVCQVSAYASVAQGSERAWIWLNNAIWQGSEYVWSTFNRVLNKLPVLNKPGLRTWQGCEYAWLHRALNMPVKAWKCPNNLSICVNMIEYVDIYLEIQNVEYARICLMQYIA